MVTPNDLALPDEKGTVPQQRIANADSARSILDSLLDGDKEADQRRAEIQGIIDGTSPYRDADLVELGQEERININWGHAEGKVDTACAPYYDTLTSVPQFVTIQTNYGKNADQNDKWSRSISANLHRRLEKSPKFRRMHQLVQRNLVIHGPGCLVFRDATDWNAEAIPPSSLIPPPRSSVEWTEWEYCFILDEFYASELYNFIRRPRRAAKKNWDVPVVRKAISNAAKDQEDQKRLWSWWEDELKNNSLYVGQVRSNIIRVAHLYVREFTGRVSHYIFERENPTSWLLANVGCYKGYEEAFCVFLSNIGNGFFQGVRGVGQRVYKYAEAMNRVNNALLEGTIVSSALMMQTESAGDVGKLQTLQIGPYRVLPPGLKVAQVNLQANLQGPMAVAQYFQGQESEQLASFLPTLNGSRKQNKQQVEIEMGEKAQLTSTRFDIYMADMDIYYAELYRRISNPNILPEDPGGKEALAFQRDCFNDGVPAAALLAIESVKATRSIGQGSSSARILAMAQIGKFVSMLPEDKRNNVIRDSIAAVGGQTFVDRYAPELVEHPTGIDASIASLENNAFMSGGQVIIDPNQNHYIHCSVHLKFFGELVNAVQEQKYDPRQALRALQIGGPHLLLHLKYLQQDPTRKDQFEQLNQQTAELMKMADQIAKYGQRLDEEDQQKQQQQQQPSPEMAKTQALVNIAQTQAQSDMKIKEAKATQAMKLRDLQAAQRLHITNLHTQVDLRAKEAKIKPEPAAFAEE